MLQCYIELRRDYVHAFPCVLEVQSPLKLIYTEPETTWIASTWRFFGCLHGTHGTMGQLWQLWTSARITHLPVNLPWQNPLRKGAFRLSKPRKNQQCFLHRPREGWQFGNGQRWTLTCFWPFKIQNLQKNMEEHGRKDPNLSNIWFVWYLIDAPFTHPTIPSCFRMSKKQMCECALACSTQQEASSDTSRPHNLFPSTLRPWPESRVSEKASFGDPIAIHFCNITWTPRLVQGNKKTDDLKRVKTWV